METGLGNPDGVLVPDVLEGRLRFGMLIVMSSSYGNGGAWYGWRDGTLADRFRGISNCAMDARRE
jgi:hypothetical protein